MDEVCVCRTCGEMTSHPPEEMSEWDGLCPDCVVKVFIFPKLTENEKMILDAMMNQRAESRGIAIVVPGGKSGDPIESLAKGLAKNPAKLLEVLEFLEKALPTIDEDEKPLQVKKEKVVKNNPRWS